MTMTYACGMWMILQSASALIVIEAEGATLVLFIPISDPMILSFTKLGRCQQFLAPTGAQEVALSVCPSVRDF